MTIPTVVVLLALATVATLIFVVPPHVADLGARRALTKEDVEAADLPFIGDGPLERVVALDRSVPGVVSVHEPFTGEKLADLGPAEAAAAQDAPYALQRYGYWSEAKKTIALTFDDGPDRVVTPKLLDLLGSENVPATFFVLGKNAATHPDVLERIVREGHAVGGHTMTHANMMTVPDWREQAEVVGTERVIRDVAGIDATMWRMPYDPQSDPVLKRASVGAIMRAQRMGYVHVGYSADSRDWEYFAKGVSGQDIPLPDLSRGENLTLLIHDAGGRSRIEVLDYTRRLITAARAAGYTFHTVPQVAPPVQEANAPTTPTLADAAARRSAALVLHWPTVTLSVLFILAVIWMMATGVGGALLAVGRRARGARRVWPAPGGLSVSVALAAFNEEKVITRTLEAILAADYPVAEVVVVDDGSKDATAARARAVAEADPRVRVYSQPNAGKAAALNAAIERAQGEIVVTLDADTIMTPATVGNLVRHFTVDLDGRLGAVAGVVKAGNRSRNLLTRWQALEYLTQIGIERAAQDALRAITIVPGACAAWRKAAILDAGGYNRTTLAEDCDLALTLHERGWRVSQDDEADAFTEVPESVRALLKQRVRWTFGTLQATWKHRAMLGRARYGALGLLVLPGYALSILVPLIFLPLLTVMAYVTITNGGAALVATYFAAFLAVHALVVAVGIWLLREDWRHLLMVPLYRLMYEPLRAYLLYTSLLRALKGVHVGWNKLERTGTISSLPSSPPSARGPKPVAELAG